MVLTLVTVVLTGPPIQGDDYAECVCAMVTLVWCSCCPAVSRQPALPCSDFLILLTLLNSVRCSDLGGRTSMKLVLLCWSLYASSET